MCMSEKRTYTHIKDHGNDISYENEIGFKNDDRGNLDLTKQIDSLKAEKVALYKQVKDLRNLEEGHQKLNGELRLEIVKLTEDKEKILKDQDLKNDQHTIDMLEKDNEIGRLMKKITERGNNVK